MNTYTTTSDSTNYYSRVTWTPAWNQCLTCHQYHWSNQYCVGTPPGIGLPLNGNGLLFKDLKKEEPTVPDNIDHVLMDKLTAMRDTRDAAARYAQSKNDEASLHEIEAIRLRAQASMMYREINEGVPVTPDDK